MECGKITGLVLESCSEFTLETVKYEFRDDICLKDDEMYGRVLNRKGNIISVEVDNGNRYMKGKIVDLIIV